MAEAVKKMAKGWLVKLPANFELTAGHGLKHSFLLPGLNDACRVDQIANMNGVRFLRLQFFYAEQAVSFAFIWGDGDIDWQGARKQVFGQYDINQEDESRTDARFMLCSGDESTCAKEASRFIRGSETIAPETETCLDLGLHLLTEARGLACYSKEASTVNLMISGVHGLNQFERFAILFALGLAYRQVLMKTIALMGDALTKFDQPDGDVAHLYAGLSTLRESVLMFDARHYFHLPVRPDKQELFTVMQQFMDALHVQPLHEEMSHQVLGVSRLADHKLETLQQAHREAMLFHQQQAADRHDRKVGRLNLTIALAVLFLGTIDLLTHSPSEWMGAIKVWLTLLAM